MILTSKYHLPRVIKKKKQSNVEILVKMYQSYIRDLLPLTTENFASIPNYNYTISLFLTSGHLPLQKKH